MEKGAGVWLALPTLGPFIGKPGRFCFSGIYSSHRAHGPAGPPVEQGLVGIILFPGQSNGWMQDLLHEER